MIAKEQAGTGDMGRLVQKRKSEVQSCRNDTAFYFLPLYLLGFRPSFGISRNLSWSPLKGSSCSRVLTTCRILARCLLLHVNLLPKIKPAFKKSKNLLYHITYKANLCTDIKAVQSRG